MSRRKFIQWSGVSAAGILALGTRPAWSHPLGSNDDIRVGVIGLGWLGPKHVERIRALEGVRVVALCDVDPANLSKVVETFEGSKVFATTDERRLLELNDVDAVVIATCDHWHALLSIWACQAGKDVYVEKPVSHTVWEGQQMVAAA